MSTLTITQLRMAHIFTSHFLKPLEYHQRYGDPGFLKRKVHYEYLDVCDVENGFRHRLTGRYKGDFIARTIST